MTLWSWSTLSPGWAASTPLSASASTAPASLISFFISATPIRSTQSLLSWEGSADRLEHPAIGGSHGRQPGGRVGPGARHGDVDQAGRDARRHLGQDVHRQLLPL